MCQELIQGNNLHIQNRPKLAVASGFALLLLLVTAVPSLTSWQTAMAASSAQFVPISPTSFRDDFYGGSQIPFKFQLFDQNGNPVSNAVATIWVDGTSGSSNGNSNTGNTFRYDSAAQQYIFNLETKSYSAGPGSPDHIVTIQLGDGTVLATYTISLD